MSCADEKGSNLTFREYCKKYPNCPDILQARKNLLNMYNPINGILDNFYKSIFQEMTMFNHIKNAINQ